ncbi:MAG: hypothetical protein GWO16_02140 [Gammaproteobacteria bacterium]|nr:hypothetical protein [Gammaproteobacteria bacterium]NIR96961.1 hypothetical protein [Gammaproteobacteria bacterium]NIT62663.1 hypothetical protein [Gammaproteobacteria bacterium]NIV19623.1 hypothetical protein [Gammaproteobacteria bacterium]NIX10843.1 hypothetical protein [Gammaproteobacteria bacterium]
MSVTSRMVVLAACVATLAGGAHAALSAQVLTEDKSHVRTWNEFARGCLALHRRQVEDREVRTESRAGGYTGNPEFFREVSYYDSASGHLLSRVQWEQAQPERMHAIEVYVRDEQGRVIRDYAAAFLPHYRNAPVQTLINLHNYNGELHSFRQFDASTDRIYEYCEGTFRGKPVQIRLFEDDLAGNDDDIEALMGSDVYRACFDGMPAKAGEYLTPQ